MSTEKIDGRRWDGVIAVCGWLGLYTDAYRPSKSFEGGKKKERDKERGAFDVGLLFFYHFNAKQYQRYVCVQLLSPPNGMDELITQVVSGTIHTIPPYHHTIIP